MDDLTLDKTYSRGDKGKKVKLIQEWLCLHGIEIVIDSDFGPATEFAVKQFQKKAGLKEDGRVGKATFERLVRPMVDALMPIPTSSGGLGQSVVRYAKQHFTKSPREVGGQNRGPWVRLYMDGHEGEEWPWCAGFACFVLRQACDTLGVALPITPSFSCDSLAASAKEQGLFMAESPGTDKNEISPGWIFLNRRTSTDWVHTGVVLKAEEEVFLTIEGNTNDDGSREGYAVYKRVRGYGKKDFIVI